MSHPVQIQNRPVLCAVFGLALASAVTATSAQAALIEASGSFTINGGTPVTSSDNSDTDSVSASGSGSSADFAAGTSFLTSVDQDGTFSVASGGNISSFGMAPANSYEAEASILFSESLTNTTAFVQEQLVTINLAAGAAEVSNFDFSGSSDALSTKLMLDLSFGSTNVYSSGYQLQNNGGIISRVQLGSDLFVGTENNPIGASNFSWSSQVITIVLGQLNPGTSSTFNYSYGTSSSGSISDAFCDVGEGSVCGSRNNFSDPISFALSTRVVGGPTTSVPEPATGALLGLGLFALLGSRRRLRNSA